MNSLLTLENLFASETAERIYPRINGTEYITQFKIFPSENWIFKPRIINYVIKINIKNS